MVKEQRSHSHCPAVGFPGQSAKAATGYIVDGAGI